MRTRFFFIAQVAVPLLTALASGQSSSFQWPDSSKYWRVIVNANQFIESYVRNDPSYFVNDKLVTDLAIRDVKTGDEEAARQTYDRVRKLLESKGMYVGTYVSGRTVRPAAQTRVGFPPYYVAVESLPAKARYLGSWPKDPDRKIIDVDDADTRHALWQGIEQLWKIYPAPIRFVDNMTPHPAVEKGNSWTAACAYIGELRSVAESTGSRAVFNIPMHVGLLSEEEARQLIHAVGQNGIVLELPWHRTIRESRQLTEAAVRRYRQLLDSGMAVIMIPEPDQTVADLGAWVKTWRKPMDHLYVASPFFQTPQAAAKTK